MTVVLEARALVVTPEIPQADEHAEAADALEEVIAAHRLALLELAPHQEDRPARIETGWHMERLGLLLCLRDAAGQEAGQTKAPAGLVQRPQEHGENTSTDRSRP